MTCSKSLQASLLQFNQTFFDSDNPAPGSDPVSLVIDYWFNFTKYVSSDGATAFDDCYTAAYQLSQYFSGMQQQYPSIGLVATTFMENIIGNIMNFNYLLKQLKTASSSKSTLNVYFYLGRFTYLILYFEPLTATPNIGLTTQASI